MSSPQSGAELLRYTALATLNFAEVDSSSCPRTPLKPLLLPPLLISSPWKKKSCARSSCLKSAREAKAAAERDAARLREQLNEREEEVDTMRQELVALRREREEVRTRVEKMLGQIEALTSEESA